MANGVHPSTYINDIFGEEGLLAKRIPGYKPREEQIKLASAFANYLFRSLLQTGRPILSETENLFISEAPCGTGKTYAYLFPAVYALIAARIHAKSALGPKQILITTAGISLQEQLVQKDIPTVLDVLAPVLNGTKVKVILLKGVNNYLCLRKLTDPEMGRQAYTHEKMTPELRQWVTEAVFAKSPQSSATQDIATAPHPPDPKLLPLITSTSDECVGSKCPQSANCLYIRTRNQAAATPQPQPSIVVTNHHMYAHLIRKTDDGALDHKVPAFIIADEAHELPEVVRSVRTTEITDDGWTRAVERIVRLVERCSERLHKTAKELALLPTPAQAVLAKLHYPKTSEFITFTSTADSLTRHRTLLSGLDRSLSALLLENTAGHVMDTYAWHAVDRLWKKLSDVVTPLDDGDVAICRKQDGMDWVNSLVLVPEDTTVTRMHAMFSATIRYDNDYTPFAKSITTLQPRGAVPEKDRRSARYRTYTAASPFDWRKQALVVLPEKDMLHPKLERGAYNTKLCKVAEKIVAAAEGRTLFACTSWASVRAVAAHLRATTRYKILEQGELGKGALIEAFRVDKGSVLVGTLSMWTGVDVPGEALSCLVIDRIPFRGGLDPFVEKRKQAGEDWYRELVLPRVGALLAQGFGRLIRSQDDVGVCVILDPRIHPVHGASYGAPLFRSTFPEDCSFSTSLDDIQPFLKRNHG